MLKRNFNIVQIGNADTWNQDSPFLSAHVLEYYRRWLPDLLSKGYQMHRCSIDWYTPAIGTFEKSWVFKEGHWGKNIKPVKPDLILDKTRSIREKNIFERLSQMNTQVPVINNPHFRRLVECKISQYSMFQQYMPRTYLVRNREDFKKRIGQIPGNMIVMKPLYGYGGKGVHVVSKEEAPRLDIVYPILIQKFIDASGGIPKHPEKRIADLRVIYVNHKPLYCLYREAGENSYLTNLHESSKIESIPLTSLPKSFQKLAKSITRQIRIFENCHYSLDFMFDKRKKPFLIELNTRPGIGPLNTITNQIVQKKHLYSITTFVSSTH